MKKLTLLFLLAFPLIIQAQNYYGPEEDIDQILTNIKAFSKAVVDSDSKALGMAYTHDAKIFPSDRYIIRGRDEIESYWNFPEEVNITYHKIFPEEIKVMGYEAYDYGYYEGKTQKADGSESKWKGKYVIVWRKRNGEWRIYLDIWNRIKD